MEIDTDKIAEIVAERIVASLLGNQQFVERVERTIVAQATTAYDEAVKKTLTEKADAIVSACLTERVGATLSRVDSEVSRIVRSVTESVAKHGARVEVDAKLAIDQTKLDRDKLMTAYRKAIRDEVHRTLGASIDQFSNQWAQAAFRSTP